MRDMPNKALVRLNDPLMYISDYLGFIKLDHHHYM
jgi:hypothetical protein